MSIKSLIEYFVNPKDKLHPDNYRKGKFFIVSTFIFFLFAFAGEFYVLLSDIPKEDVLSAAIGNGILCAFVIATFFIYKNFGKRILLVNIITIMGYMSNIGTYDFSGGIYSSDLATGIVICSWIFLVADKVSGIFWFAVTFCTILFFYFAEINGWKDFRADSVNQGAEYYVFNFAFSAFFLGIIIILHEANKDRYLKELVLSKSEVENKSKELEAQKEDIISSINYAKRIQYAVLPHEETIYRSIPLSFILYKPKDIVSGDYFWFHEIDKDNYIIVCADCTGHGVPGAFMTVIGSSLLNQIVIDNKITQPSKILSELDKLINMTLKQQKEHEHYVQDGMDLALLKVNKSTKEFIFTSAKRPAILIRDKQLQEFKGSKFTLGGMVSGEKNFEEIKMNYKEDDVLYMFTDGFTDQFGGPKGKKYSIKQLRENLLSVHKLQVNDQKTQLDNLIVNWQAQLEQVDDILLMGIKF